jgi:hypothetical protein
VFFVKITTIDNLDFVINLERVTLLGRTSRIVDGITKDFTSVHYDMSEGTVTIFTVDCTLEQFHDFMEHFFSSTTATGPSLPEFLQTKAKFKPNDTVKVTLPQHFLFNKIGTITQPGFCSDVECSDSVHGGIKKAFRYSVHFEDEKGSPYFVREDFLEAAPTPVKKSDIETLARMNAILSEANLKVRRRKEEEEILSEILKDPGPHEFANEYDGSPLHPLPISGIRRKTQPDVSQQFLKELLNEPPQPTPDFRPGDTVEVIDKLHPQFGRIGIVIPDIKLHPTPSLVVIRFEGKNTQHDYALRKDQIQHSPYSPQKPNS